MALGDHVASRVLVTLGGCHLLDGLVARGSIEARKQEDRRQPESLSQWGLAWWQPSEPRYKNHHVNFVYSSRWFAFSKSEVLYLHSYISCAYVVALVIS